MKRLLCLSIVVSVIFTTLFHSVSADEQVGKLSVYVVNYPLQYFAERIGREYAQVVFPAPSGEDPAYWTPDAKSIAAYQRADLILLNGANYAKWIQKVSLPQSKLVNTSSGFKDNYIYTKEAVTHTHGPGGSHAHESAAFTVWLDFSLAVEQAGAITKALSRKKQDGKETFQNNFTALEQDLLSLDQKINEIVAQKRSIPLIASHPVYAYFTRRYGLNIRSVHWEPDEMPTDTQWSELQGILEDHPARWMIWESEPLMVSVEKLKSMGIGSIVFNPCGNASEQGDFFTVMEENVRNLKLAFKK